jgi:hypothetical protein
MPELQSLHNGTLGNRGLNVLRLPLVLMSFVGHAKLVKGGQNIAQRASGELLYAPGSRHIG